MAGNSYPHIIFAKTADTLPQHELADLVAGVLPGSTVEPGEIKAQLHLEDGYGITFWYDDDADGLGERYADYADPLHRKRLTRCTTMIDASGDDDPDGAHADVVTRLLLSLARHDGVYVFSEDAKSFLSPEADVTSGVTDDGVLARVSSEPEADLRQDASYPAHAEPEHSEVLLESEEASGDLQHTEEQPVDRPTPRSDDVGVSVTAAADPADATTTGPVTPEPHEARIPGEAATSAPAPAPAPESPAAAGTPIEPARGEEPEKQGLFKRLFGRKR